MAIRWLLQKNVVSSVIIGANNLDQLEANVGATGDWRLSREQVIFLTYLKQYAVIGDECRVKVKVCSSSPVMEVMVTSTNE